MRCIPAASRFGYSRDPLMEVPLAFSSDLTAVRNRGHPAAPLPWFPSVTSFPSRRTDRLFAARCLFLRSTRRHLLSVMRRFSTMGTPDGRKGWGDYFLQRGYAVYIVDQPARARSGYFTDTYGPTRRPSTGAMSSRFTAPERANAYPQAKLHTQWPGTGVPGDPIFDQFFASQLEDIADTGVIERLNRAAGIALLDKIGPAILLTHSQSGPFGWQLADARPKLVKGILAVEPNGPPFYEMSAVGAPNWFEDGPLGRACAGRNRRTCPSRSSRRAPRGVRAPV